MRRNFTLLLGQKWMTLNEVFFYLVLKNVHHIFIYYNPDKKSTLFYNEKVQPTLRNTQLRKNKTSAERFVLILKILSSATFRYIGLFQAVQLSH